MAILLTGANGIVGCEVVRALVKQPGEPLFLLLRGSAAQIEQKRRWLQRWSGLEAGASERLQAIEGDVTTPGLGLSARDRERVQAEVTGVLHSAAVTAFDQTPEQAFHNNVTGTRNALEVARGCRRLERFGQISTAYVAGRRTGLIREDELDLEAGFFNEYEHSKALAEIEALKSGLPVAVYRVGIVIGRASDGQIARMIGPYLVLRLLYEGLVAMFPGEQDQVLDLIPADYAGSALAWLFQRTFSPGSTVHVCAGAARSFTMPQFFSAMYEAVGQSEPGWIRRGFPVPVATTSENWRKFIHVIELVANERLKAVVRQVDEFTRPLESPKVFDVSHFEAAMRSSGVELPHVRDWLPRVVEHAVKARFRQPGWEMVDDGGEA
jgi:nucleoside-diphosphate-sugar epimerase